MCVCVGRGGGGGGKESFVLLFKEFWFKGRKNKKFKLMTLVL